MLLLENTNTFADISKSKLKSLLELSLRTSSVADIDPYKDDLTIDFHPYLVPLAFAYIIPKPCVAIKPAKIFFPL